MGTAIKKGRRQAQRMEKMLVTSALDQKEALIREALIGLEGELPAPDQVLEHGGCQLDEQTGDQVFYWKGREVLRIGPVQLMEGRPIMGVKRSWQEGEHHVH